MSRMGVPNLAVLKKDIAQLAENFDGVFLVNCDSFDRIVVAIHGPPDTPYATGVFKITISPKKDYPQKAPEIHFQTPLFHPNVDSNDGRVCADFLDDKWKPSITLKGLSQMVRLLLGEPNAQSPLNLDASDMMFRDPEMYTRTVLTWTHHLANGAHSYPPYDEDIQIMLALNNDIGTVVRTLTACYWDAEEAGMRL